jgi:hypothetical protein
MDCGGDDCATWRAPQSHVPIQQRASCGRAPHGDEGCLAGLHLFLVPFTKWSVIEFGATASDVTVHDEPLLGYIGAVADGTPRRSSHLLAPSPRIFSATYGSEQWPPTVAVAQRSPSPHSRSTHASPYAAIRRHVSSSQYRPGAQGLQPAFSSVL